MFVCVDGVKLFKSLLLLQFSSDSRETWHCLNTQKQWNRFKIISQQQSCLGRQTSSSSLCSLLAHIFYKLFGLWSTFVLESMLIHEWIIFNPWLVRVVQLQQLQDRQASLLRLQRESERRLDDRREVTPTNRGDQRLADTPGSAAAAADVGMATEVWYVIYYTVISSWLLWHCTKKATSP